MMKYFKNIFVLFLPLLAMLGSCGHDEIVFDYEKPQFELRDDAILIEVVMPQGTAADDNIYIVGDFNGGQETALESMKWLLEKAADNDIKWGIYLYPDDFISDKTLANGFYFVSKTQGAERTLKGEEAIHTANATVGTRVNVTVSRWNAYFETPNDPVEVEHDGYAVFVVDNTGWDNLALYAWGYGIPELFGGWPGILPTGTADVDGITYKYFDTGEANKGLTYNLIMNNNGGGSQFDLSTVTLDRDYYFRITDKSGKETNSNEESEEEKQ